MHQWFKSNGHFTEAAILPIGGASVVEGLRPTGLPRLVLPWVIISNVVQHLGMLPWVILLSIFTLGYLNCVILP